MLPTQLLSETLNTSLFPAHVQEVNTTGIQVHFLLRVFREEVKTRGASRYVKEGYEQDGTY